MPLISVTKCQGTGNDFILLDARAVPDLPYAHIARFVCQRRFAIGADGLLVLSDPQRPAADASMRIFNPDGSEAEMCGNGIRCVARYLHEQNPERTESRIETLAGLMETRIVTWQGMPGVSVAMGEPAFKGAAPGLLDRPLQLGGESAPAYGVSMGNPHIVLFTARDPAASNLAEVAGEIATWKAFDAQPNVELAQVVRDGIRMRVHERGVGETWACGTGACATAAAAIATGRATSPVTVQTKGGLARVDWRGSGHPAFLTGNAELIFRTEIEVPSEVEIIHARIDPSSPA
ncbi:MAG TPA: diaminopimelate epimerase [Candidatus Eremiobacteraceae bacterium]|nr:diaminopimelate epimerase [Candidatus Eremiobacteraceae bacterium]